MTHKIVHHRVAGILPAAAAFCNSLNLAEYAIQFVIEPNFVTLVLRVPNEKVVAVWRKLGHPMYNCPIDPLKAIEKPL